MGRTSDAPSSTATAVTAVVVALAVLAVTGLARRDRSAPAARAVPTTG